MSLFLQEASRSKCHIHEHFFVSFSSENLLPYRQLHLEHASVPFHTEFNSLFDSDQELSSKLSLLLSCWIQGNVYCSEFGLCDVPEKALLSEKSSSCGQVVGSANSECSSSLHLD